MRAAKSQFGLTLTCRFPGCQSAKLRARGYCGTHYNRLQAAGEFKGKARNYDPAVAYAEIDNFLVAEVDASEHNPSVRNLYYRAVAEGMIKKDAGASRASYQLIVTRALALRKMGRIDWDRIADESRSATTISHFDDRDVSPREMVLSGFDYAHYSLSPWQEKVTVAEVWVESRSAAQSLRPVCGALHVDLVPLAGQSSWAFIREQVIKIGQRKKDTHVLCLTDYDKSGLEIAAAAQEKADYFLAEESLSQAITFERIGITEEQIEAHNLPTGLPNAKSRRKRPDITRTCEIEAMRVDDLAALVKGALASFMTEADVGEMYNLKYRLDGEAGRIADRAKEVIEDEFM